jgi:hypothetical protein
LGNVLQKMGVKREQLFHCPNFLLALMDGLRWAHCHEAIPGDEVH